MRLPRVVFVLCFAAAAVAQGQLPREQEELARKQRSLQGTRGEVDRLIDMRMRHDLGLPKDDGDDVFRQVGDSSTTAMDRMRRELNEEEGTARSLRSRFESLRRQVEDLQEAAAARLAEEERNSLVVTIPATGSRPDFQQQAPVIPMPMQPETVAPGEVSRVRPETDLLELDPVRAQIHGSDDHQRVAQALFKAGQALLDRGAAVRAAGDPVLGKQLDDRGRERLQRAIAELQPLLEQKEPPYVSLFYLGRCRELLFRYSERHEGLTLTTKPRDYQQREQEVRDPFLQITARDVDRRGERGENEVLGQWGQAAQTAVEHFRWMNLHAGFDVGAKIKALTWPGEGKQ